MTGQINEPLIQYSDGTKNVCMCTIISIFLIFIFIVSPVNNFVLASMLGKLIILLILAFALYKNLSITFNFSKNIGMFEGEWNNTKTNVICSYLFSAFIFILIFSVLKRLF
jgi:hypothetical protein